MTGQFVAGTSGNPVGRPKGSKNKITLVKLMAEQAVREGNYDRMVAVCEQVIEDALAGDFQCRKLIWQSMVTKAAADDRSTAKEKVEINLNVGEAPVRKAEIIEDAEVVEDEEDAEVRQSEERADE